VQAICFRKPVENLNSCQTIVRQKRRIFPSYRTGNMLQKACENNKKQKGLFFHTSGIEQTIFKNIDCGSKQFVKHLNSELMSELIILSDISQAISLQKCIQIADIFHCFCDINASYQN
jgi:hypothetical protein